MTARTLAIAATALLGGALAAAFAFTSQSADTSTSTQRPRPIAGITNESVPNVLDQPLADAARAFFTSLLERQYRAQPVPIASAAPRFGARLQALPVAGNPDTHVAIVAMRYADKPDGVRQVTVHVDEHLPDHTTQPLAANFRKIAGTWRAISLPTFDEHTPPTNPPPPPAAPPAALHVARAYALAARSWTPDTLRAKYQQQLRLSTGPLHSALLRSPPTAATIAAYRAGNHRMTATIRDVQLISQTTDTITVSIVLAERTHNAGPPIPSQHTVNTAQLQHRNGRWLISGFTANP